ncbi:MAG: hypothetical protein WCW02_04205 [Candidatus Buchananbacteria bacterium]
MPLEELQVVKKLKTLVQVSLMTKKQIVEAEEKNAKEHRLTNQLQEKADEVKVSKAQQELKVETEITNQTCSGMARVLIVSLVLNLIFFAILVLTW